MKILLLCVAVCATLAGVYASDTCDAMEVYYCSDCRNPPMLCYDCYSGYVLEDDQSGCRDCGMTGCKECEIVDDATVCVECYVGYVMLDDSTCEACSANCLVCSYVDESRQCDVCAGSYQNSNTDADTCVSCGTNCLACNLDDADGVTCTQCATGTMLVSGSCISCPSNCDSCNYDTDGTTKLCSVCSAGRYRNDAGTSCISCPSECAECQDGQSIASASSAKCVTCKAGYYTNTDGDGCDLCVDNCAACSDGTSCDTCNDHYYIDSSSTCSECPWNCLTCSEVDGTVTCSQCYDEYALKDDTITTCDPCPSNCDTCTSRNAANGKCTTCSTGYYRDTSQKCQSCPSNCDTCNNNGDISECDNGGCESGYILDDNNQCQACAANCASGSCTYNTTITTAYCSDCDNYFAVKDDTECVECTGCEYCNYNIGAEAIRCRCSDNTDGDITDSTTYLYVGRGGCATATISYVCDEGYYLDPVANNGVDGCVPCNIDGCIHCNGTTSECIDCDTTQNYASAALADGSCYACSGVSNCLQCTHDGTDGQCTTCKDGYEMYTDDNGNAVCKRCGTLCAACSIASDGTVGACSTCTNYGVKNPDDNTGCLACPTACIDCEVDGDGNVICKSGGCLTGYALNTENLCEECGANCVDCEYDSVLASVACKSGSCDSNYGRKSDGSCDACPTDCLDCSIVTAADGTTDDILYCDDCDFRFAENTDACTPCPSKCATCSVDAQGSVSGTTADTYYRVDTDGSCPKCPSQCQTCTATSCSACDDGFGLSADRTTCVACNTLTKVDQCSLCENARSDGNATCLSCNGGYILSDNSSYCNQTSLLPNCKTIEDHYPECITCEGGADGRYLDDETQLCVIECYTCGSIDFEQRMLVGEDATCNPVDGNYTTFPTEKCFFGYCGALVLRNTDDRDVRTHAVRGCFVMEYLNATCIEEDPEDIDENLPNDNAMAECRENDEETVEACGDCCFGNLCNDYHYSTAGVMYVSMTLMTLLLSLPFM